MPVTAISPGDANARSFALGWEPRWRSTRRPAPSTSTTHPACATMVNHALLTSTSTSCPRCSSVSSSARAASCLARSRRIERLTCAVSAPRGDVLPYRTSGRPCDSDAGSREDEQETDVEIVEERPATRGSPIGRSAEPRHTTSVTPRLRGSIRLPRIGAVTSNTTLHLSGAGCPDGIPDRAIAAE